MKKIISIMSAPCLLLVCIMICVTPAVALEDGGGGGTGDGTGGGNIGFITLNDSTIRDGDIDVELSPRIVFYFSNNVIAFQVRDKNSQSFTLADDACNAVEINVILADEQLERELRRYIGVEPVNPLQPGRSYTLTIDADLEANNGNTLGQDITITFTTAADSITDTSDAAAVTYDTHDNIVIDDIDTIDEVIAADDTSAGSGAAMLLVGAAVVIAAIAIFLVKRSRSSGK